MIKRFFLHLILLISLFVKYSSSNYTLCTSHCSQITVTFLQPLLIPFECQEKNNLTDIYANALVCIIEYRIDYDAELIYINFKASNDTNTFPKQHPSEFLSQTLWLGFNQEAKQPNITHRKYGCNTKADCAREFYLNTIEYLITNGRLKLDEIHLKLYNQSNSSRRRCKDSTKKGNRTITRCENGLCYAHNIDRKQYCTSDNTPTLFSLIEYQLPKSIINKSELIEYKCNKHLCNSNAMMDIIKNLLLDYTNWNNNNIPPPATTSVIPTETADNQIKEKSFTIKQTISYCLILFSLINLQYLF